VLCLGDCVKGGYVVVPFLFGCGRYVIAGPFYEISRTLEHLRRKGGNCTMPAAETKSTTQYVLFEGAIIRRSMPSIR
jgi:hypothetical protein